ncbi:thioredoxin [Candidatus Woesearchaeota archaeon]|nr:thioredoxin [Candidatus Woesearchaeota archaeon]
MEDLDKDTFKDATAGTCIIDFWAPWCGPCKMQGPILEQADKEHDDVRICKVNVDEHKDLAQEHGVSGIPTLVFYKDGQEVHRHSGVMMKDQLDKAIEEKLT